MILYDNEANGLEVSDGPAANPGFIRINVHDDGAFQGLDAPLSTRGVRGGGRRHARQAQALLDAIDQDFGPCDDVGALVACGSGGPPMNHTRKCEVAPQGLTKLTKTTLADLLWWHLMPHRPDTEESAWMAIEHAAKALRTVPNPDRLTLRTLIRIRRKRTLR